MRRRHVALLAACVSAGVAGPHAAAETPLEEQRRRLAGLLESIPGEFATSRQILEADLAHGRASGVWTEEDAAFELARIREIIDGPPDPLSLRPVPPRPGLVPARREALTTRLIAPLDPTPPTTPVARWLCDRLLTLTMLQQSVRSLLAQTAMTRAEEVWLAARKPADLEPARSALVEARAALPDFWQGAVNARQMNARNGDRIQMRGPYDEKPRTPPANLADFWSIIASSEPLVLPDPEQDSPAFARMRRHWGLLAKINHPFIERPPIAAHFAALNTRFEAMRDARLDVLDKLVLGNAPVAELEAAWSRVEPLVQTDLDLQDRPDSILRGNSANNTRVDYLDWIVLALVNPDRESANKAASDPEFPSPAMTTGYRAWLRFRKAEDAADAITAETARQPLTASLHGFRAPVSAYLRARLAAFGPRIAFPQKPPPITPPAQGGRVPALIAALENIARASSSEFASTGTAELAAAWSQVEQGRPLALEGAASLPAAETWLRLATTAANRRLLALRDAAAREALVAILGPDAPAPGLPAPIPTLIQQEIEKALLRDRADEASRLLELDAAGAFLLPGEHTRYAFEIAALVEARQVARTSDPAATRLVLHRLLTTAISPAVVGAAIRQLKSLPGTGR